MALSPGSSLGTYEILSPLGAGGMGEVYRAHDTRLGRDVAIKILPDAFASDPDRVARFQREAHALAALNHPHIASIYGIEEFEGTRFLVLECVDGESLDAHVKSGALRLDEALAIARQIIDALEAAHDKGIVHRDLKPANVMLTDDGQVKVLDFGLAKMDPASSGATSAAAGLTHSPTMTFAATQAGVILGTAAYMSPEQVKGRPADKRSDVWAFGCVLFEMLAGKRAFEGEDISDTLASILRGEPDWNALPTNLPAHVTSILRRCLQKDRKARIPDLSVVRFVLDDANEGRVAPAATPSPGMPAAGVRRLRLWQAATALLACAAIGAAGAWYAARTATAPVARFVVAPPDGAAFSVVGRPAVQPVLSPDGRMLVFSARDASGKIMLYLRPLDALVARPLPGTENGAYPFWSPDARFIAFSGQSKMMKVAVAGGPPQTICSFSTSAIVGRGGAWNRDGVIVFNNGPGPLHRVSAAGGDPSPVFTLAPGQNSHNFPTFLPDGRHVLFHASSVSPRETGGLYVGSLDTGETKRLTAADTGAVYDASSGRVLFARDGTLLSQPFDVKRLTFADEPVPIAEHVETSVIPGIVSFSLSATGTLAYGIGSAVSADMQLTWVDRQGKVLGLAGPPGNYRGIDLSPNGQSVAAHRHEGQGGDLWIVDLVRGTTSRFTFDASQDNSAPIWSADGTAIAFASLRAGKWGIYRKSANSGGVEQKLFETDGATRQAIPMSWAPDGRTLVFSTNDKTWDIWRMTLTGDAGVTPTDHAAHGNVVPMVQTAYTDLHPQISPDGRWMSYWSTETGRSEVAAVSYPSAAAKWQVSVDGGTFPRWRADGRELFFMTLSSRGNMMAVDVKAAGLGLQFGQPHELFDSEYLNLSAGHPYHPFAVSPDGQKFLIPRPIALESKENPVSITVVMNWAQTLNK